MFIGTDKNTVFLHSNLFASGSAQVAAKEPQRAVPRLLRPHGVVLRGGYAAGADGGFVGKRVVRQVAVELGVHARSV